MITCCKTLIDGAVWLAAKVQFSAKPPPLYSVEIKQKYDIALKKLFTDQAIGYLSFQCK